MSRLRSISLDRFKSPVILGIVGGAIVLLVIWWFAWMVPEATKLNTVHQQQSQDASTVIQLRAEIALLQRESAQVQKDLPYLKMSEIAVPPTADPGEIVNVIDGLANKLGLKLTSITDSTVVPPTSTTTAAPTSGVSTIPITFAISGSHKAIFSFMSDFYGLPRLMTLESVSLSPTGAGTAKANILSVGDGQQYTANFTATAYTTNVPSSTATVG